MMEKTINLTESNEFLLSAHKVTVSFLIQTFVEHKATLTRSDIGKFCLLILKLVQGLDISYASLLGLVQESLPSEVIDLFEEGVNSLKTEGLGSLIDLIQNVKTNSWIHKSSFLGIFVRKMSLYFDKLSFTSVTRLYEEFCNYAVEALEEEKLDEDMSEEDTIFKGETNSHDSLLKTCPKQLQYFISKQIKLIQVNERRAMNPRELYSLIRAAEAQSKHNFIPPLIAGTTKRKNDLNDLNFLRYLNCLRVNEYPGAKESLFAYFDGVASVCMNKCWAALNLAMLHSHFNHNKLALEAIKECISTAQEVNDERCLEYALLWIAKIIINQKEKSNEDQELLSLLSHLQTKATKLELFDLSIFAALHYEKITGLRPKVSNTNEISPNSGTIVPPDILCVRYSLVDVLMMTYACQAAHYSMIGASSLTALVSQILLHLEATEAVGNEFVYHVNESTCIGFRNLALHLWRNMGKYDLARDVLQSLGFDLFSSYSKLSRIWKQALAEIEFEYHLYNNNWKQALGAIKAIKVFDVFESKIRLAELKYRQKGDDEAYSIVNDLLRADELADNLTIHTKIRILLLKSKILENLSLLFECLDLTKKHHLLGLECITVIEMSRQMQNIGQYSRSQQLLKSIMIPLLANATLLEIGTAHYLEALNYKYIYDRLKNGNDAKDYLKKSLEANERSISKLKVIGDKESLKLAYTLQAHLHNDIGNHETRNYFARQVRCLQ